jgi:SHS family sialic acid transporter-like MFS transporter
MKPSDPNTTDAEPTISRTGRWLVLIVALLGWGSSGFQMAITQLAGRPAMIDLLETTGTIVESWTAYFQASMLFGGATGGLLYGWVGDRFGRARGLTISIFTSSGMAAVAYFFARSPEMLCICWFLSCLGLGGMWPNGVALISESWSGMARSTVSGVLGMSANVGLFAMNYVCSTKSFAVSPTNWRFTLLVAASSLVLGIIALLFVPESPHWLKLHRSGKKQDDETKPAQRPASAAEIFSGPLLATTLVAIVLATVPTMGGWGSAQWMVPWADKVGSSLPEPDQTLKAQVGTARALTGIVGSFIGAWIAVAIGRKLTYFLTSFGCLCAAQYTFWNLQPTDAAFLPLVAILGFFSGIYFGWLPLCMPEFFPTRNRSTGAGVCFNFGRIFTACTVFSIGAMMAFFKGDYAAIGKLTSLIFLIGMIVIWFAPISDDPQLKH